MDGVFELLSQDGFAGVPRHLEQEETGVTLRQKVVSRVALVHYLHNNKRIEHQSFLFLANHSLISKTHLKNKVPSSEVRDGPGESSPAPDEPEKQGPLGRGELLHHRPEPLDQRGIGLHT